LALESVDVIGEEGDGERGLEFLDGMAQMQMSVSRGINPWRIGSLQSWNGPFAVNAVMLNDILGLAGRDVDDNRGFLRYHELDAP
jgi:hypothetical protein